MRKKLCRGLANDYTLKLKSAPCIAPLRGAVEGDAAPAALRLRDGLPELGDVPHGDVVGVAKCRGPSHSEIGRTLSPTSHIPHPRFIVSILCKETEEGTRKMGLVVSHSFKQDEGGKGSGKCHARWECQRTLGGWCTFGRADGCGCIVHYFQYTHIWLDKRIRGLVNCNL